MTVTLGLDLGPNSIGWALIDEAEHRIINLGTRIFPEGVDNFDTSKEKSRNEDRRIARGMRRQTARRQRRKRLLRDALIQTGLWPAEREAQAQLEALDPYELRARAVDPDAPPLSRLELGRVILHLNQRRGFKSLRKKEKASNKEEEGMLAEISDLAKEMGGRTLGQHLHDKARSFDPVERKDGDHIRKRHTRRSMLDHELKAIAARHPDVLTPTLMYGRDGEPRSYPCKPGRRHNRQSLLEAFGIHGLMFFQRSLYWPKSMIGLCELEPKQPRCPRADRHAQRFRLLQEVNNLRYIDPDTNEEKRLDDEQRALLIEKLSTKDKMEFKAIRDALGFMESVKFNLEKGERSKLQGAVTDHRMAQAKVLGKDWHKRPEEEKDGIVRVLIDPARDDDQAERRLMSEFGLSEDEAQRTLAADLPAGYMRVSLKAIDKLLPHMKRGLVYQMIDEENSAVHAAGYLRADQLQRRIFDKLPDPAKTHDSPIGDIPNPVVRRALVELRKLVNAIIREHGKPDAIHVEMARDVRQGERARREYNKKMRERETERDTAADKLRENGVKVTRDAINRYLLWQEQDEICVYSGNPISFAQLFSGEVDVDHILPYSRCLDDSLMNKVVCFRHANADKNQRSPHEWLADAQPENYDHVCQRARKLPWPKYRRFIQKELELDKFIARQLVDTSYIARATSEYLRCLFDHPHDVLGLKGQLTAELRHQWGVNGILNADGIDVKSREDHRHHAVDAVIVALTDRSRLQQLTRIRKAGGVRQTGEALDHPWDGFRDELVEKVNAVNVSHRADRKVAGALHLETLYGPTETPGVFVARKDLEAMSANEVELIRDDAVRDAVKARLAEHGVEVGRGKKAPPAVWKEALCDPKNPVRMMGKKTKKLGPPIKKVRLLRREQTIQPIRSNGAVAYVKPGSTHHLSLFEYQENGKIKREAVFTTMLEAMQRIKRHEPIITRTHPKWPRAKFLFSLSGGELVLAKVKGEEEEQLLVFSTAASTSHQMWFFHHADARPRAEKKKYSFKPQTLKARKVTVDYLGRIRWAND